MPTPATEVPTEEVIRTLVQRYFKKRACLWQIRVGIAIFLGRHVMTCSQTGSGKTLAFWIPLLIAMYLGQKKCIWVATPLTTLGKQGEKMLEEAGIKAVAVSKQNCSTQVFKVSKQPGNRRQYPRN